MIFLDQSPQKKVSIAIAWDREADYLSFVEKLKNVNLDVDLTYDEPVGPTPQTFNYFDKDANFYNSFIKKHFKRRWYQSSRTPNETQVCRQFDTIKFLNEKFDEIEFVYIFEKYQPLGDPLNSNNVRIFYGVISYKGMFFRLAGQALYAIYTNVSDYYKRLWEIELFVNAYNRKDKTTPKVYMVMKDQRGYYLEPYNIETIDLNIAENYNDDFIPIDITIREKLSTGKKGVVLLHGDMGTGKTFYIRYLVHAVDKRFIFIPSFLSRNMTETGFMTFLVNECKNSVLILEDHEEIVKSRDAGGNTAGNISDLLNMTDGILSDVLNIQFICTFNTKLSNIDKALKRKGRLIAEYFFEKLTSDKTQSLASKLKINITKGIRHSLAELFNYNEEIPGSDDAIEKKTMGFTKNE